MKKALQLILLLPAFSSWLACAQREEVKQYAAIEKYPADTLLTALTPGRAMVLIAHDDDMCAMTGTLSILNKKGWVIKVLSIDKGPKRNEAHRKACRHLADTVSFLPLRPDQLRRDTKSDQPPYYALPKSAFDTVFIVGNVKPLLLAEISGFKPDVLFTLDHELGGYGHPEHVFISDLVFQMAQQGEITPRYLYQSVFSDHMEVSIMGRHRKRMISWGFPGDEWDNAKEVYQTPNGMPEPDVQITIVSEAEEKMQFLQSYNERERKTLGFFIPAFQEYTAHEYFSIFDREFFRIIRVDKRSLNGIQSTITR